MSRSITITASSCADCDLTHFAFSCHICKRTRKDIDVNLKNKTFHPSCPMQDTKQIEDKLTGIITRLKNKPPRSIAQAILEERRI